MGETTMNPRLIKLSIISATALLLPLTGWSESHTQVMDELVVTGTSKARVSQDTPFAVTDLDEDQLRNISFNSRQHQPVEIVQHQQPGRHFKTRAGY